MSDGVVILGIIGVGIFGYYAYSNCWLKQFNLSPDSCGGLPLPPSTGLLPGLPSIGSPCQKQDCPCGYVFDEIFCKCSPMEPSAINFYPISPELGWKLDVDCVLLGCILSRAVSSATYPCDSATSNTDVQQIIIRGSVEDSRSNPICNKQVDIQINPSVVSWDLGFAHGRFVLTHPDHAITDDSGQFSVPLNIQFVCEGVDNVQCALSVLEGIRNLKLVAFNIQITGKLSSTQLIGLTNVTVRNGICATRG